MKKTTITHRWESDDFDNPSKEHKPYLSFTRRDHAPEGTLALVFLSHVVQMPGMKYHHILQLHSMLGEVLADFSKDLPEYPD